MLIGRGEGAKPLPAGRRAARDGVPLTHTDVGRPGRIRTELRHNGGLRTYPGCARSGWQGAHACVDLPTACWMWIKTASSEIAGCRGRSRALEVWSSSSPGCARSGRVGRGSHSCVDPPAACLMWNHCGSRRPATRASLAVGRAGLWECKAAPLRAVPRAAGKGPTLVWTCPRLLPAGC